MPGRSGEHSQLGPGLDHGHPFQVEAERWAGSCANLLGKWRFPRGIVRQFSRSRGDLAIWQRIAPQGTAWHKDAAVRLRSRRILRTRFVQDPRHRSRTRRGAELAFLRDRKVRGHRFPCRDAGTSDTANVERKPMQTSRFSRKEFIRRR